jgi:hypothetical protein
LQIKEQKQMTHKKWIFLTMLTCALLLSPMLRAQTWSTVASSCQPGSDSVGLYAYSDATFEFASGVTGTIRTRCQVNNPLDKGVPKWDTLTGGLVVGLTGGDYVQITLNRASKSDGSTRQITSLYVNV